ncbi:unnamed protein product [Rhizoctonia solani]|uniref:F-box domain-containing protein n=1 Tax=Rhizoctonia solani TaxID=456999 RepID=A0A8H3H3D2_9AGAM|nr:unnamed protein product [Rhizoctonia solani]
MNIMTEDHHIATQKLARVPELLAIICTFLEPTERKKIASVSRGWFLAATPVIWKEITGVHHLLALVPGVVIKSTGMNTIMIRLPPVLDFTRFDIYAPLVKSLDLYGDSKHSYEFDWKSLEQRRNSLLPHLSSLTMRSSRGSRGYGDQLMWTILLASSSLREIRFEPSGKNWQYPPTVTPVVASLLLHELASQCPDLQVLSIFPEPASVGTGVQSERVLETFLALSKPPFYHCLSQLPQLCELACNEQILKGDVLPIVASLPLLAHLQISASAIDIDLDDIPLPDNAFPSLRRLSLYLALNGGAVDLWEITALRQLTSLHIEFRDQHKDDLDDPDSWALNLLSTIAENNPNLQHLYINFSLCDSCEDEPCNLGNIELLEGLSMLPLKTVTLKSAWFGPYDPDVYGYITDALPEVIELRMPAQPASVQELAKFAQLPSLQHLVLDLDLTSGPEWDLPPAGPVGLALHTLETEGSCILLGDLVSLAKSLLLLWPNLQRVVCPDDGIPSGTKLIRSTLMESLNSSIMMVREASKLKKLIAKKYGLAEAALFNALPTVDYIPFDSAE